MQKSSEAGDYFPDIFEAILQRCTTEETELFAVTTRKIWLRRNAVLHGEIFSHPTQLLKEAQNSLEEFQRIYSNDRSEEPTTRELTEVSWKPPPSNIIKLNWNAGVNVKDGRVGLGLIARDS